ncbi:bifunctional WD40-YVTN repeat-like-containing domain superfamily/WD40-repeat-containing domain superfamily [Babesia duncani]|uniref:Bifunctional WD40-YVTN repeat-like-containing domain superfamily/WD40-repeat-containing domain superfamily n=1 Tax=Babesia duncani TaxID=323732 RepID=A0AAD9UP31_9APIC|nr:bifunctional WD40-YVTN repeat-like-containing domain superfamily/WD40-repeat-containing domain superfamily [Babesia duncani]
MSTNGTVRWRTSSRSQLRDRRKNALTRRLRFEVGRLDTEAFETRTKYLREIFLDVDKRNSHDWTALEKKILLLDWCQNPQKFEKWKPAATEDMQSRFFANLIFNYSHLAMINSGMCIVIVRLVPLVVNIKAPYQCVILLVRDNVNGMVIDRLKVGLIWRGKDTNTDVLGKSTRIFTPPLSTDFQFLSHGIGYNFKSLLPQTEFEPHVACSDCISRELESLCTLETPDIVLESPALGMEVTSSFVNGHKVYLVVTRGVDGIVRIHRVQELIQTSIDIIRTWEQLRLKHLKRTMQSQQYAACTGCLVHKEELQQLYHLKQCARSFAPECGPMQFVGLEMIDVARPRTCATKREACGLPLALGYTSVRNEQAVIPSLLMAMASNTVCIWSIYSYLKEWNLNPLGPIKVMTYPDGTLPTDISSTVSIAASLEALERLEFIHAPKFYTTDDRGHLSLWSLGSTGPEAQVTLDQNALCSCAVNRSYPHIVAVGLDVGKIKIYNTLTQGTTCIAQMEHPLLTKVQTLQSFLPDNVYDYQRWYHPVVKLEWISDVFILAQYSEPIFTTESTNASAVAIWNVVKDIFDRDDALVCNKHWSLNSCNLYNTWHLASKLVCLYGGHFGCICGVLSSDAKWSAEQGLLAVTIDSTGQLHVFKPGIWTWGDCDDPMAIARLTGDCEFYHSILARVQEQHRRLSVPVMEIDNSVDMGQGTRLRKTRAKFSTYIQDAQTQLESVETASGLEEINSLEKLPMFCKKTLRLNSESEKYLKLVHRLVAEREHAEFLLSQGTVTRPPLE